MARYKENPVPEKENKRVYESKYLQFLSRLYVIMILSIYPLYVGVSGYDDIVHSKAVMFWTVSIIFFVAFALFYAAYRLNLKKADQPLPFWKTFTIPDWAALAFLLVLTISFLTSPYKEVAWYGMTNRNDGYMTYFCMIMSYFILSRWYKPQRADLVFFSAGSAAVCIIGFLQYYGYDFMNLFPYDRHPSLSGFSISFRATIGNVDFVSAYVGMTIAIFGILYVKSKGLVRLFYLATSAMNFILMIISDAESGKVSLLATMVLLIPYWFVNKTSFGKLLVLCSSWGLSYVMHHGTMIKITIPYLLEHKELHAADRGLFANYNCLPLTPIFIASMILLFIGVVMASPKFKYWPDPKKARIAGFVILGLVMLVGLIGVEVVGQRLPESNTIHQAREVMRGNMQDGFGSSRGYIWRKSLEQFSDGHPLFGTGPDTFYYAFGKENQQEALEVYFVVYDKAHNDFIQVLLCNGILALMSYIVLIISMVILSIKESFYDDFLLVAIGGAIAYMIQSFFGIDTLIVTPIYWIMLAIARQRQNCTSNQEMNS